jgi:cytochrome bd ubiquinol oxidase subunit I
MDALMLSRIQFGISIGFHYLFPVATLGLTLYILIFETLYLNTKSIVYRNVSNFFIKILALIFTMGVATGLMMPFAFGANWARFSIFAGPVFGAALSIEATTAFALESAFLAILLFGRNRVSPFMFWLAAALVFLGSHLSGFWIVAANSWLQTPAGYTLENGRLALTSIWEMLWNHSTLIRFLHVITGAWLTGSFIAAGIAAYYAARDRFPDFSKTVLRIALPLALATAALQPLLGHFHILNVLAHNPEKDAAYEGMFCSTNGATLYAFGIPDEKNKVIRFGIGLPYGLSLLESGNPFSRVKGLEEYPRENWPPVNIIFTTFHLMVALGMLMIGAAGLGVFLLWKKKLFTSRWFLQIFPFLIPVPFLANELGWAGTEIGRQPWLIYKVMRTAEATSARLPAWQIGLTLAGICLLYAVLLVLTLIFLRRMIRKGPAAQG